MSPADLARMVQTMLDTGADTICLDRQQAWDVVAYLWTASWAELLGWDCKRTERRHHG